MRRRFFNNKNVDINNYLTIEALEDNLQVRFPQENLMYSIDGMIWQKLIAGQYSPPINAGQTISFKGNLTSLPWIGIGTFTITKRCNLLGNCMSMLFGDDAVNNYSLSDKHSAFWYLFHGCTTIIQVSESFLPATTLADSCYYHMFSNCTNLTTAPELPATTLADSCYYSMFRGCSSLVNAPSVLPATTLADRCYYEMFLGCRNLTTAPSILPATTLADSCYYYMFSVCTSLTTAPELPATTLVSNCYYRMFYGCSKLITAPELPATTLAEGCYQYMFYNCRNLNYIKMLATDISASNCLNNWVNGVSSTGTFVKNPAMISLPTGYSGIPEGWTVVNDVEVDIDTTNSIIYTSSDGNIVRPYRTNVFGATIISNEYNDGKGVITFDSDVTLIGDYAFNNCRSLTSVTIPDSVTEIGDYAFSRCTSLTSVNIPDSVTSIGSSAFWNCSSLTSVYCKATTPPLLGDFSVFDYNGSSRKIYVPAGYVEVYKSATRWNEYADAIVGYDFGDESVNLITFYVAESIIQPNFIECTAIEGMTWGEWIDSEYNTLDLYIDGEHSNVIAPDGLGFSTSSGSVHSYDIIINGKQYSKG